ncbi:MAG: patatin-like phospholipase family protein, partial [Ignavibacteriales bacterium]
PVSFMYYIKTLQIMKSLLEALKRKNKDLPPVSIVNVASEFDLYKPFNISTLIKLLERQRALVLGGGGAKGSFELGAIEYIYKRELYPQIICGTSVGSINGAKLAEGEGPEELRGLKGLQFIWYNLMNREEDMVIQEPSFADLPDDAKEAALWIGGYLVGGALLAIPLVGYIFALGALGELGDKINAFLKSKSWYNLSPMEDKARKYLNTDRIKNSGIKLRIAIGCLNDTNLRYVTENGTIIEDDGTNHGSTTIIDGILASAAIPTFFNARKIGSEYYVDGGVREVVPIRIAIDAGATEVIAVVASAPPVDALRPPVNFDDKSWLDIAFRALDMYGVETLQNDTFPVGGWKAGVEVKIIRPGVEVHGAQVVGQSLIRINSCYGYMSAFDKLDPRSKAFPVDSLAAITNAITVNRMHTVPLERSFASVKGGARFLSRVDVQNDIDSIRKLKNELLGMIRARVAALGSDSLPRGFDENWVNVWESGSSRSTNLPDNPWQAFWVEIYRPTSPDEELDVLHIDADSPKPIAYPPLS